MIEALSFLVAPGNTLFAISGAVLLRGGGQRVAVDLSVAG